LETTKVPQSSRFGSAFDEYVIDVLLPDLTRHDRAPAARSYRCAIN